MRAIVCGGRDFTDSLYVSQAMEIIHATRPITLLIHGAARGADTLGGYWAFKRGIERKIFPAQWEEHGRAAGAIRNRQMLEEGKPELVIAFPGGKGTANMVQQARAAGIAVIELDGKTYGPAQAECGTNHRST
jgi:hypothetical protein